MNTFEEFKNRVMLICQETMEKEDVIRLQYLEASEASKELCHCRGDGMEAAWNDMTQALEELSDWAKEQYASLEVETLKAHWDYYLDKECPKTPPQPGDPTEIDPDIFNTL